MRRPQDFEDWPALGDAFTLDLGPGSGLLDALADLWFIVDPDGRHREAGSGGRSLLPLAYAELQGRPLEHGLPRELAGAWSDALARLRAEGRVQRLEVDLDGSDGARRAVETSVAALPRGEALFLLRDRTQERARMQADCAREAAAIAGRAKSEFLSRVSHEMRTPLNAVIGFTQLLRLAPEGAGPDQVAEFTDHVLRASQQLLALINDLLDLQRVEDRRLALDPRPLALRDIVDAVFTLQRPLAARRGVVLRNEVDAAATVLADAQRTRQVLINIVSNAIQYNRPGGWVRVALRAPLDGRIVFAVEDTGPGLTAEELARLFQPFERLGRESGSVDGGGLGLVIARRLAEAMGGALDLGPRAQGSGAEARIALPAAPQHLAAAPDPGTVQPPALRVLYVEDNRINAILFEEAMRLQSGIALLVAEDGAEALALAPGWQPQVLVLDAHLPDMNGYELLAHLRDLPALARTPAYMCSADAQDDDLQRARAAGFAGYWTKPIDIARVLADLRPLLPAPPPGDTPP
jgi:signal transduction histidine kinase/CheY-like chemotaxis protein